MATLVITELHCFRKNDLTGVDEPRLWVDNKVVWRGVIEKEGVEQVGTSDEFEDTVGVMLEEMNGDNPKQIGSTFFVNADGNNPTFGEFKTSGTHYHIHYQVHS